MSSTIEIDGIRATVDGYEWECEDKRLLRMLKLFTHKDELTVSSYLKDPDPDIMLSRDLKKRLKGRVIEEKQTPD